MHFKHTNIRIATWIVVGILCASTTQTIAAPMYQALGLGSLIPGGYNYANAINSSGQIVGFAGTNTGFQAFLYSNGSMVGLGTLPGYTLSYAYDINDRGQIVGASFSGGNVNMGEAFIYDNGAMTGLGTLPDGQFTTAYSINNAGVIVGQHLGYSSESPHFPLGQPFIFDKGGMMSIPGWDGGGFATKISDDGQVLINSSGGAIYAGGLIIPFPCESSLCYMADINTQGEIAGYFQSKNGGPIEPFLYKDDKMISLGLSGHANAINDNGEVVGFSWDSQGGTNAFLYTDNHLYDLNSLVDPSSGWVIWDARDINDSGLIVAYGQNTLTGYSGGVLLTPISSVPEPETLLLFLTGLILMAVTVHRSNV